MTTELIALETNAIGEAETLSDQARDYARASKAPSTLRNYRSAWLQFEAWCQTKGRPSLPASPATVAVFLSELADAGAKASTLNLKRAAVGFAHRSANLPDPTAAELVSAVLSGIVRKIGTAPDRKAPLTLDSLRPALAVLQPDTFAGVRDRAVLLLGFACALRRSELVALDVADLQLTAAELRVRIRKSKTDQAGAGAEIVVPAIGGELCPVAAVRAWLDVAAINSGPIFRPINNKQVAPERLMPQSVALIVKRAAKRAGLDWRRISAHSLRAGFATQAELNGVSQLDAMAVTRHKSQSVFAVYVRAAGVQQRKAIGAVFTNQG